MAKKVLSVGQCLADDSSIRRLIESRFDAAVDRADDLAAAIRLALAETYDLILVNRILDADLSPGIEVIKELKSDPRTMNVPIMLVSNFVDAQATAIEQGALPGFGKATLTTEATACELAKILD